MSDEKETLPPEPAREDGDDADTEGHSFVNPAVYSDLARQRQKDIEQDARRAHPAKHEPTQKKRRWPFG